MGTGVKKEENGSKKKKKVKEKLLFKQNGFVLDFVFFLVFVSQKIDKEDEQKKFHLSFSIEFLRIDPAKKKKKFHSIKYYFRKYLETF